VENIHDYLKSERQDAAEDRLIDTALTELESGHI
jgi:hypothetical protein